MRPIWVIMLNFGGKYITMKTKVFIAGMAIRPLSAEIMVRFIMKVQNPACGNRQSKRAVLLISERQREYRIQDRGIVNAYCDCRR